LFCSPNLLDHPRLALLAIPEPDQISGDPGITRYADDWVRSLNDEQVARYGALFDAMMERVAAARRKSTDVVCEVLSTWPYPLRRVMERYQLGRFCVTQKADMTRREDVYRSENASPRDWIMVGNHDTEPIWRLADAWHGSAAAAERALYLARRLAPEEGDGAELGRWIAAHPHHLCQAMFADLFVGKARCVSIFFADMFGLRDIYNRPGVVHEDNWRLRLRRDFADDYRRRVHEGAALNLPLALCLAMHGRRADLGSGAESCAMALLNEARRLTPSLDESLCALLSRAA
jgi:hypothetical protein